MKWEVTVSVLPTRRMTGIREAETSCEALHAALQELPVKAFIEGVSKGLVISVLALREKTELLMTAPPKEPEAEGLKLAA